MGPGPLHNVNTTHATAGSITTLVTNPIWTVQTAQATRAVTVQQEGRGEGKKVKPTAISAAREIIKSDGVKGLWRGIGPALILVINPVIQVSSPPFSFSRSYFWADGRICQYTTFERLVDLLLSYRLSRRGMTPMGKAAAGRSSLSDWDFFFLGALSKLVATGGTYPYVRGLPLDVPT